VARDITEKKRLEEAILESRDNLNRIVDQTPLAVMVTDADGDVSEVNEAWLRMFDVSEKGSVVHRLNVFRSPFFRVDDLYGRVREAIAGRVVDIPSLTANTRLINPGSTEAGIERTLHIRIFPVIGRSGHLTNVVAMFEDVTERRHLEAQLIQSQKMESIGFLAGGIAHDFNNILGGILGYASFIKKRTGKEHSMYPHLETIEKSALRAAELVSQLLAFARGGKYVVTPLAINDILVETAGLLKGTIDKSIEIDTELDPASPVIEADAVQMQQVLMNLCVNARDAMPEGGKLVLRTVLLDALDDDLRSIQGTPAGAYVRIDIQDSGIGIDAAIKEKIFDPFFTTKEKGKGTGLGLATVYGIVKNHGGHTRVESEVGKGTTFSVYLPAVDVRPHTVKQADIPATGGNEQILIVDDEPTIRILLEDVLKEMGYRVVPAAGGAEALSYYAEKGDGVDLVILDMAMPGMNGKETFERLKAIDPDVRVILSTGYSEDERARELFSLGIKGFVGKPYRVEDLAAVVRRVLDGK
jgi:two-component system cell cycle sensor histidine kinase/response regulator CckA